MFSENCHVQRCNMNWLTEKLTYYRICGAKYWPNYKKRRHSSDPLAQSIAQIGNSQSETNLLEKVMSVDQPIDLPKMLGKENNGKESILEREKRLQNERYGINK